MPILQNRVGLHRVRPYKVPNVERARVTERPVPAKRSTDRLTRNSHMLGKNGNRTERIAGKAYCFHRGGRVKTVLHSTAEHASPTRAIRSQAHRQAFLKCTTQAIWISLGFSPQGYLRVQEGQSWTESDTDRRVGERSSWPYHHARYRIRWQNQPYI